MFKHIDEVGNMCQLFGYSGKENIEINSLLKEFYSHSDRHPNGWGLAVLSGNHANIEREVLSAEKSAYLKERLRDKITAPVVLAHIRYATIGNVELRNCHPFTAFDNDGRRWTLIHNGTIFDYAPMDEYIRRQRGDTDSERILLYLIDKINEEIKRIGRSLEDSERFEIIDKLVGEISTGNKLNLLIYDGSLLYAHCNLKGSLYFHQGKCGVLFSTEPLINSSVIYGDGHPGEKRFVREDWEEVPLTTLVAYKDERLAFKGTQHGNEYHEDTEALNHLYLAYSHL